jgi:hypothetical protein
MAARTRTLAAQPSVCARSARGYPQRSASRRALAGAPGAGIRHLSVAHQPMTRSMSQKLAMLPMA